MCMLWKIVCKLWKLLQRPLRKGPKQKAERVNDHCRICKLCSFEVQFRISKCSTENLFKSSERKESKGLILANAWGLLGCRALGVSQSFRLSLSSMWKKNKKLSKTFLSLNNILLISCNPLPILQHQARQNRKGFFQQQLHQINLLLKETMPKFNKSFDQGASSNQLFEEQNAKCQINNLLNSDMSQTDKTESKVSIVGTYLNGDIVVKKLFCKHTVWSVALINSGK